MQTTEQERERGQTGARLYAAAQICKEWKWIALRGGLAILLGFAALAWPLATIWALALLWGAFALADGISAGYTSWRLHKKGIRWWPYALFAATGVIAGVIALLWPGITAVALIFVIGCWAVVGGVSEIVAAIRLRKEIEGEWFLIFAGAVSVLFGFILLFRPLTVGVFAIIWMISFYAFITGGTFLMLAWQLRQKCNG